MTSVYRGCILPACALLAGTLALPAVTRAQEQAGSPAEAPGAGGQQGNPVDVVGVDRRASFAAAVKAAESARTAAVADARATYKRRAAALESASESLTAHGRRRIEEGPLRQAREALTRSLAAAEATFDESTAAAVGRYGGSAQAVFSEASAAIDEIRLEYEVYVAVVGAADAALRSERAGTSSAEDSVRSATSEYEAARAEYLTAQRGHSSATAATTAARRTRPEDPKPDYASSVLGGLTAGLAEAAGEYGRAEAIRGQLEQETSTRLGEHAASVERYQARLAEAEDAEEAAATTLAAARRRYNAASARLDAARRTSESAGLGMGDAYEARTVAGIEAARITKVHGIDELEDVDEAIRKGAVAAIAEIETELLSGITDASAAEVFRAVVDEYAAPRQLAIDAALGAIEEEYADALRSAESDFSQAIARVQALLPDLRESLASHYPEYQRAIRAADSALQDALVWYYRKDSKNRERKFGSTRRRAADAHESAIEAARATRRSAISRDVPGVSSFLAEMEARLYERPDRQIYGGPRLSSESVVSAMSSYKKARARCDAQFNETANAYMQSMRGSASAALRERREEIGASRAAARSHVVTRVIGADSGQAVRLRALETAIPSGLLAVARQRAAGGEQPLGGLLRE